MSSSLEALTDLLEQAADAGEPLHLTTRQVETAYEALCRLEELEETLADVKGVKFNRK